MTLGLHRVTLRCPMLGYAWGLVGPRPVHRSERTSSSKLGNSLVRQQSARQQEARSWPRGGSGGRCVWSKVAKSVSGRGQGLFCLNFRAMKPAQWLVLKFLYIKNNMVRCSHKRLLQVS